MRSKCCAVVCCFFCNCYCNHHCSARCNEPLVRVYPLRSSHCLGLPHPSRQTQTSLTVTPSGSRFGLNSLNLTLSFDLNFCQFWVQLCIWICRLRELLADIGSLKDFFYQPHSAWTLEQNTWLDGWNWSKLFRVKILCCEYSHFIVPKKYQLWFLFLLYTTNIC